jgi:hypothetical protein
MIKMAILAVQYKSFMTGRKFPVRYGASKKGRKLRRALHAYKSIAMPL